MTDNTQWLNQIGNDPTSLARAASSIFSKIDQLDSTQKEQVYSQLRSDVKFQTMVERFQPAHT